MHHPLLFIGYVVLLIGSLAYVIWVFTKIWNIAPRSREHLPEPLGWLSNEEIEAAFGSARESAKAMMDAANAAGTTMAEAVRRLNRIIGRTTSWGLEPVRWAWPTPGQRHVLDWEADHLLSEARSWAGE